MQKPQERMPRDRLLIQESLKKVAEGPDALMKWAAEHYYEIDQKFINILRKMIKYSQDANNTESSKLFQFLDSCFTKMFNFSENSDTITVSNDNVRHLLEKSGEFLRKGKPQEAIRNLQAISIYLAHNPHPSYYAVVDANLGIAYAQLGFKEKAVEYLDRAIQSCRSDKDKEKILANVGTIYRDLHQYDDAIQKYQEALEIARKREDREMVAIHLSGLALVNIDRKNLEEAFNYEQEAYEIAQKLDNKPLLQDCLTKLAMIMAIKGDKEKCKELCEKGLSLMAEGGEKK